jgi:hypothetical protein
LVVWNTSVCPHSDKNLYFCLIKFLLNLHYYKNCLDRCNNFDLNVCLKLKSLFSPDSNFNCTYLCVTIPLHDSRFCYFSWAYVLNFKQPLHRIMVSSNDN